MAVVFKYKKPLSYAYAPGFVRAGTEGPAGISGANGNAVYFIDYALDNSYSIENALLRIENNTVLSSNSIEQLQNRSYRKNDLIISNSGIVYRLKESSSESLFNNYKFDIEELGSLSKSTGVTVKLVVMYDFTNVALYRGGSQKIANGKIEYAGTLLKTYPRDSSSCIITNRTEKLYTDTFSFKNKDNVLVGSWIKILGYSETYDPQIYSVGSGLSGYSHSFVISLKNTKNMSCDSVPVSYRDGDPISANSESDGSGIGYSITFNKKLEYPNISYCNSINHDNEDLINYLFREVCPKYEKNLNVQNVTSAQCNKTLPGCTTVYLSDYIMDELKPSNNNVKCTISSDRNMWFGCGISSYNNANLPSSMKLGDSAYIFDDPVRDENDEYTLYDKHSKFIENSLNEFGAGLTFTPVNIRTYTITSVNGIETELNYYDSSTSFGLNLSMFPQYAVGLNLTYAKEDDFQKEMNDKLWHGYYACDSDSPFYGGEEASLLDEGYDTLMSNIIQFPIYNRFGNNEGKTSVNYKGGNSLYFSGINDPDDVSRAIFDYVANDNNSFSIISRNAKTREVSVIDVPVLVDTSFRDSSIYVYFKKDTKGKTIKVSGLEVFDNTTGILKESITF